VRDGQRRKRTSAYWQQENHDDDRAHIGEGLTTPSPGTSSPSNQIEYLRQPTGIVQSGSRSGGAFTKDFQRVTGGPAARIRRLISIGEMRDFETIKIALTAAETGCLVLSTLHIMSIDKIIERLLSFTPSEDEGHIRYVLADTLVGVIHQELVPTRDGGKRVACEILIVNQATKHIIRNRGTFFLRNVITTGRKFGMVSMQSSLEQLVAEGAISPETMRGNGELSLRGRRSNR
jgi:twitching motility protein PilT